MVCATTTTSCYSLLAPSSRHFDNTGSCSNFDSQLDHTYTVSPYRTLCTCDTTHTHTVEQLAAVLALLFALRVFRSAVWVTAARAAVAAYLPSVHTLKPRRRPLIRSPVRTYARPQTRAGVEHVGDDLPALASVTFVSCSLGCRLN